MNLNRDERQTVEMTIDVSATTSFLYRNGICCLLEHAGARQKRTTRELDFFHRSENMPWPYQNSTDMLPPK